MASPEKQMVYFCNRSHSDIFELHCPLSRVIYSVLKMPVTKMRVFAFPPKCCKSLSPISWTENKWKPLYTSIIHHKHGKPLYTSVIHHKHEPVLQQKWIWENIGTFHDSRMYNTLVSVMVTIQYYSGRLSHFTVHNTWGLYLMLSFMELLL